MSLLIAKLWLLCHLLKNPQASLKKKTQKQKEWQEPLITITGRSEAVGGGSCFEYTISRQIQYIMCCGRTGVGHLWTGSLGHSHEHSRVIGSPIGHSGSHQQRSLPGQRLFGHRSQCLSNFQVRLWKSVQCAVCGTAVEDCLDAAVSMKYSCFAATWNYGMETHLTSS